MFRVHRSLGNHRYVNYKHNENRYHRRRGGIQYLHTVNPFVNKLINVFIKPFKPFILIGQDSDNNGTS